MRGLPQWVEITVVDEGRHDDDHEAENCEGAEDDWGFGIYYLNIFF